MRLMPSSEHRMPLKPLWKWGITYIVMISANVFALEVTWWILHIFPPTSTALANVNTESLSMAAAREEAKCDYNARCSSVSNVLRCPGVSTFEFHGNREGLTCLDSRARDAAHHRWRHFGGLVYCNGIGCGGGALRSDFVDFLLPQNGTKTALDSGVLRHRVSRRSCSLYEARQQTR